MKGSVRRGMRVDEIDYRILVLNWIKRRGAVEKEEEVKEKKWTEEGTEKEQ